MLIQEADNVGVEAIERAYFCDRFRHRPIPLLLTGLSIDSVNIKRQAVVGTNGKCPRTSTFIAGVTGQSVNGDHDVGSLDDGIGTVANLQLQLVNGFVGD